MKASLLPAVLLFIITFTAPLTGWAQHKDSLPDISSLREPAGFLRYAIAFYDQCL